ncbi:hypothetical protein RCL1_003452 [Eukaryota sp. TZLM3-RCL]
MRILFGLLLVALLVSAQESNNGFCERGALELDVVDPNCSGYVVQRLHEEQEEENNQNGNNQNGQELVFNNTIYAIAGSRDFPLRTFVLVQLPEMEEEETNQTNGQNGNMNTFQNGNNNNNQTENESIDVVHLLDTRFVWDHRPELINVIRDLDDSYEDDYQGVAKITNQRPQIIRQRFSEDPNCVIEAVNKLPEDNTQYNETTLMYSMLYSIEHYDWREESNNYIVVYTGIPVRQTQTQERTRRVNRLREELAENNVGVVFVVPSNRQQEYEQFAQELRFENGNGNGNGNGNDVQEQPETHFVRIIVFEPEEDIPTDEIIDVIEEEEEARPPVQPPVDERQEVIIRVEVEEQPEGIVFEPVQTEIRVVLNNETHQVPVFFRAYTEECMELVELFERQENNNQTNGNNNNNNQNNGNNNNNNENGEFIREAVVRITVERVEQEEEEENGNGNGNGNNNGNNNNENEVQEQQVYFRLLRCPCAVIHQQPRCGFFNFPPRKQVENGQENGNNNNNNNNGPQNGNNNNNSTARARVRSFAKRF